MDSSPFEAMRFGVASESRALELFENLYRIKVYASNFYTCKEKDFQFFGASCDGLTLDGGIAEVKSMYGEGYKNAYQWKFRQVAGHFRKDFTDIPPRHFLQVQWELFVTGAKHCYYIQYRKCFSNFKEEIVVWKIFPDHKRFLRDIYTAYQWWWKEDFPRLLPIKVYTNVTLANTPESYYSTLCDGDKQHFCWDRGAKLEKKNISLFSATGDYEHITS